MSELVGKVLHEPSRGELVAVIYHAKTNLSPGTYLSIKLTGGRDHGDLLCLVEGPFSKGISSEQLMGGRIVSLRMVSELHPQASTLWALGTVGADVLVPPQEFLVRLFGGDFYSSSKKAQSSVQIPLGVGELRNYESPVGVSILGEEMNSHTCVLAQSGAGKSYAVGVILEEIAFKTWANIVVLDLNSDYVRFNEFLSLTEVNAPQNNCVPLLYD